MTNDIDELLRGTTPHVPPFDLESLSRRGRARRVTSRLSGVAAVALLAGAASLTLLQQPPTSELTIAPVAPSEDGAPAGDGADGTTADDTTTDDKTSDDVTADDGAAEDPVGAITHPLEAFDVTEADIEAMAERLPGPGADAEPAHTEAVRGTDLGKDPYLRSDDVLCSYAAGSGPNIDAPMGGRTRDARFGSAMTTDDVVADCLDSDMVRSGEGGAPGPFTLCRATLDPAERDEVWETRSQPPGTSTTTPRPDARTRMQVGSGELTLLVAAAYEVDCTSEEIDDVNAPVVVHGPATSTTLDELNDRRRVEVTVKAAEWSCLSGREAVALAFATAERMGGEWQIDAPADASMPGERPCWGVMVDPTWATLSVWRAGYWDRGVPIPTPVEDADPRIDDELREELAHLLRSDDPTAAVARVERIGASTRPQRTEVGALDPMPTADAVALAETVGSAGCLSSGSAYALAAAAGRLLDQLDPQAGWSAVEVAEEQIAAHGPPARSADCTSVLFAVTEFGIEEFAPTILLVPAWVD